MAGHSTPWGALGVNKSCKGFSLCFSPFELEGHVYIYHKVILSDYTISNKTHWIINLNPALITGDSYKWYASVRGGSTKFVLSDRWIVYNKKTPKIPFI